MLNLFFLSLFFQLVFLFEVHTPTFFFNWIFFLIFIAPFFQKIEKLLFLEFSLLFQKNWSLFQFFAHTPISAE